MLPTTCGAALKEWALTNRALGDGLQILLLRKGGLLDEDGFFTLEHRLFWLQPTYIHEAERFVKPDYRELLHEVDAAKQAGENRRFLVLNLLAEVTDVWMVGEEREAELRQARHIWSEAYLQQRFDYKPERPLLAAALRIYKRTEPHIVSMREQYAGCRSWLDLEEPLDCRELSPVLDDSAFEIYRSELRRLLGDSNG